MKAREWIKRKRKCFVGVLNEPKKKRNGMEKKLFYIS